MTNQPKTNEAITYVIFNGPPGSGKTTISRAVARLLHDHYPRRVITDSFAAPMKHFVATMLGEQYHDMQKDKLRAELNGYSVREFLIDLSENYIKPRYGTDAYGRWLVHRSLRYTPTPLYVVVDDSGFAEELNAVPNHVLVRVDRKGHDFTNDSRNYLPDPHWTIHNNDPVEELWIVVRQFVDEIMRMKFEWEGETK